MTTTVACAFLTRDNPGVIGRSMSVCGFPAENVATLQQDTTSMSLVATGEESELYLLSGYKYEAAKPPVREKEIYLLHFGIVLQQSGQWAMQVKRGSSEASGQGKFLLIDHMGNSIRFSVCTTLTAAKECLASVYGSETLIVDDFYGGKSNAALWRFVGGDIMNQLLAEKYSSIYTVNASQGKGFFESGQTNCLRLACDMYVQLKVDFVKARLLTGAGKKDFPKAQVMQEILNNAEFRVCVEIAAQFFGRLKHLATKCAKLQKTVDQLVSQWKNMTGKTPEQTLQALKSYEVAKNIPVLGPFLHSLAALLGA